MHLSTVTQSEQLKVHASLAMSLKWLVAIMLNICVTAKLLNSFVAFGWHNTVIFLLVTHLLWYAHLAAHFF